MINALFLYRVVELRNEMDASVFRVNGHKVKPYVEGEKRKEVAYNKLDVI